MARSSTGPITAEGKAISAQNSRKHGLNVHPDGELVNLWYNLILNNGEDASEECNARDPGREAALRLARARHKVDTQETDPHSSQGRATKLHEEIWTVFDRMPVRINDGPADPYDLAYVNVAVKQLEQLFAQVRRERRLYRRYLGEARAQRAKALRDWCAINRN